MDTREKYLQYFGPNCENMEVVETGFDRFLQNLEKSIEVHHVEFIEWSPKITAMTWRYVDREFGRNAVVLLWNIDRRVRENIGSCDLRKDDMHCTISLHYCKNGFDIPFEVSFHCNYDQLRKWQGTLLISISSNVDHLFKEFCNKTQTDPEEERDISTLSGWKEFIQAVNFGMASAINFTEEISMASGTGPLVRDFCDFEKIA